MYNVRIPWTSLKLRVNPLVTKEVTPLELSPAALGVDDNTHELYIYH